MIPAQPADAGQYDNRNGGSGFMIDRLDFNSFAMQPTSGDNRIAAWDWTGLGNLSSVLHDCGGIHFGGQLFSGTTLTTTQKTRPPMGLSLPESRADTARRRMRCGRPEHR